MAEHQVEQEQKSAMGPNGGPKEKQSSTDSVQDIFGKFEPFMEGVVDFYGKIAPYIEIGQKYVNMGWQKVEPYYTQYWRAEYIEIFIGFTLLFFGGTFAMTIACFMAIQLSGWSTIKSSWTILKRNYCEGMDAFKNDPDAQKFFDVDGDGKVSASEIGIGAKMLFTGSAEQKKAVLHNLRCVFIAIDPQEVMNGIGGLWTTAIAVIATLRSGFAKDVALGVSIGNIASKQIGKYLKPLIAKKFDEDMRKWADFLIDSACRFFGISLALILVRVVSAFHSAVKGAQIIALFAFQFLNNKQLYPDKKAAEKVNVEGTTVFIVAQYGLAAIGFYWQLSSGFTLNSWILRLILLPFSFCEVILTYLAAY